MKPAFAPKRGNLKDNSLQEFTKRHNLRKKRGDTRISEQVMGCPEAEIYRALSESLDRATGNIALPSQADRDTTDILLNSISDVNERTRYAENGYI